MGEKLHESDRLLLDGHRLPDELMPLDRRARSQVVEVIKTAVELSVEQRTEVRAFADSLPQQERPQPVEPRSMYLNGEGLGSLVMRLIANRNLYGIPVAHAIYHVTEGRRYWAASTYGMIGGGRKELTPDLLGDLAQLLDVPADVLARLTGIVPEGPTVPGLGDVVWAMRRLTSAQAQEVLEFAEALGRNAPDRARSR